VISIGTSTTVSMRTDGFSPDTTGFVDVMADARSGHLPIVAMLNGARTIGATARMLGTSLARFDRLAADAEPSAHGVVFLPHLDGERNPARPEGTGMLLGLSRETMTPAVVARAAVLGLGCTVARALDALVALAGEPGRIFLVGGGSRSAALRHAIADLIGRAVHWPEDREHAAFGAARQAAWALTGSFPDWRPLRTELIEPVADGAWTTAVRDAYATADDLR
jgi:xylulokinase